MSLLTGTPTRGEFFQLWVCRHPAATWRRWLRPVPVELGEFDPAASRRAPHGTILVFHHGPDREWELAVSADAANRYKVDGRAVDAAQLEPLTKKELAGRLVGDALRYVPRSPTFQYMLLLWPLVELAARARFDGAVLNGYPALAAHAPALLSAARVEVLVTTVLLSGVILPPVLVAVQFLAFPLRRMSMRCAQGVEALLLTAVSASILLVAVARYRALPQRARTFAAGTLSCVALKSAAGCARLQSLSAASGAAPISR